MYEEFLVHEIYVSRCRDVTLKKSCDNRDGLSETYPGDIHASRV